jgi:hypothetical protein
MLDLGIERIGELAVVECKVRIMCSEAAFKLRGAVASLEDSRKSCSTFRKVVQSKVAV